MNRNVNRSRLFGAGKICAVVAERTASAAIWRVRSSLRKTRLLEIRLDYFVSRREALRFLAWLRRENRNDAPAVRGAIFIATCRRREAGGRFRGAIAAQLAWIALAVNCGCQWADVELETSRRMRRGAISRWIAPAKWIVSAHDFRGDARKKAPSPARLLASLRGERADAEKIAVRVHRLREALDVIALGRERSAIQRPTIAVPMGEISLPARLLALREGNALAYAYAGAPTAPGQPALHQALHLYRADKLTRETRIYGIIGNPIAHSLSPCLHNAGFQALQMDAALLPFLTPSSTAGSGPIAMNSLRDFIRCIPRVGIRGFAVTLPLKENILRYLDDCDPLAAQIGAVNTVAVQRDGKLSGFNTDYAGILRALEPRLTLAGSRVLILGSGGTARTAAYALRRAGASVSICARRPERARWLARRMEAEALPRQALRRESFDAIINATPVGMFPLAPRSPLRAAELRCGLVFDAVYRPRRTRLLELAAQRGISCVPGVEMFLAQGAAQFDIWTGQRAPEAAMRKAVLAALRETGGGLAQ
jgi:3-dehydroquinate dehydratase/shikimate dehydrogenase